MKVAIVGAGITGLVLADELSELGIDVIVFEKSRGLGGRISTKRLDWGNLDIGAQYFTARDARFKPVLAAWLDAGVAHAWQFEPHKVVNGELMTSPDKTERYVGQPDMNSIAKYIEQAALRKGTKVHKVSFVESLVRDRQGWKVILRDQAEYPEHLDWVVSTLPAEQSAELFANTQLQQRMPTDVHTPCWALAVATTGRVAEHVKGIFGDDIISWVSRLNARPERKAPVEGSDLWMLHFDPAWTKKNGKAVKAYLADIGMQWLNLRLSNHVQDSLQLVDSYAHYWKYAQLTNKHQIYGNIVDESQCLAAIGAWAHGGRVEGAFLSAINLIDQAFLPKAKVS